MRRLKNLKTHMMPLDAVPWHHMMPRQFWSKLTRHHFWQKKGLISKSALDFVVYSVHAFYPVFCICSVLYYTSILYAVLYHYFIYYSISIPDFILDFILDFVCYVLFQICCITKPMFIHLICTQDFRSLRLDFPKLIPIEWVSQSCWFLLTFWYVVLRYCKY